LEIEINLFLDPVQILKKLKLKEDKIAVDFGAGSGGWAIPLATILEEGKVFAVDVQEEPLHVLDSKARLQGISNIKSIVANVQQTIPGLVNASCDLVLITNLLFQIDDRRAVFQEAQRVLKQNGRVLVVEWKKETPLGPKEGKISEEEVKDIAQSTGFKFQEKIDAGDYHFGLVFVKP